MPTTRQEWIDFLGSRETFTQEEIDAWVKFFLSFSASNACEVFNEATIALGSVNGQERKNGPHSHAGMIILLYHQPGVTDHLQECLEVDYPWPADE